MAVYFNRPTKDEIENFKSVRDLKLIRVGEIKCIMILREKQP